MRVFVEQEAIITLLDETRAVSVQALADLDLALVVEPNSGWRGLDVLARLAAGEAQTTLALMALLQAERDQLPEQTAFTQPIWNVNQPLDAAEAFTYWQQVRADLLRQIAALPWNHYHQRISTVGGSLFIGELAKRLIDHEQYYIRMVLAVAGCPQPFDTVGE